MHATTFQWVQSYTLYPRECKCQRSSEFCCGRITIVDRQVFAYKGHMLVHSLRPILHSYTIDHFLCDMRKCPIEKIIERDSSKVAINVTTGKQSIVRSPRPPPPTHTHRHPPHSKHAPVLHSLGYPRLLEQPRIQDLHPFPTIANLRKRDRSCGSVGGG